MTATPPQLAHLVLRASAGTGKTYRLSERYVALVGAGAEAEGILATTFTRLAAGEIRDRVLGWFADDALAGKPGAADRLERIAERIHRLQLRTLDSFFAGVVRVFALELGLPVDLTLVDENEQMRLRQEALSLALDQPDPEPLLNALDALASGPAERSVSRVIDVAVSKLYELYLETDEAAWHWMAERSPLRPDRLAAAIETLRGFDPPKLGKYIREDCDRAAGVAHRDVGGWKRFLDTGVVKKVVAGAPTYRRMKIGPDTVAAFAPLVSHATAVLWNDAAYRTRSTWKLLDLFHQKYHALKRRRQMLTFDDLPSLADRARRSDAFDTIFFRLDARVRHLLLDEFQDTSVAQWLALEPLAREIVADGTGERSLFCVGDVKQSIYGWREAVPEILMELRSMLGAGVSAERMELSRRSAPAVIETVNTVFGGLAQNPTIAEHAAAKAFWSDAFRPHETVNETAAGGVELRRVREPENGESHNDVPLVEAAELAARLHRADPRRTIGILCRQNTGVSRVLFELGPTRLDVPAMGHGGGSLNDAAAVNAILDALRLADHPGHTTAAFNVMRSPLGPVVGLVEPPPPEPGGPEGPTLFEPAETLDDVRWRVVRSIRRQLLDEGYAATIESWIAAVAPATDAHERMRLTQLAGLAEEFDHHPSLRPGRFVELIEKAAIADQAVAPINVMTIHKSKGLEFDVVILPELHGRMWSDSEVVTSRESAAAPVSRVVRWVSKRHHAPLPDLPPMFAAAIARQVREELCVLYVAMTRARRGLFMLLRPPGAQNPGPETLENVLLAALAPGAAEAADTTLHRHGTFEWLDEADPTATPSPGTAPATVTAIELADDDDPARRPAAGGARPASIESALWLSEPAATDHGSAIHLLFEQVEWIEDFAADDAALVALVRRGVPRRGETWAADQVRAFRTMLEAPAIRAALAREPGATAWRERPFARFDEGGRLRQGRIDRLVARGDGAVVIDFKTDAVDEAPPAAVADAVERHRGQLEGYRDAAAEMLALDPARVSMQLIFVGAGLVRAL